MPAACRALVLFLLCAGLSGCANASWLPSFLRRDPPMQAARLTEDAPAPRFIPAAFVQSVAVPPVAAAVPPPVPVKPLTAKPQKTPAQRATAANAAALQEPTADGYINAIQVYNYSQGALYRLYATPQMVSDIALQPGENLIAISAGDTARWVVGDTTSGSGPTKQVHILAKPYAAGLKTNLVITTDRRSYHLELQSTSAAFMAAVSWTYPQDNLVTSMTTAPASPPPTQDLLAVEKLHFGYAISGDAVPWKPVRAFDDGARVYIEFPKIFAQGDAPPLFVSSPNGSQDLVNYRVRGHYYVVDQLFAQAELRLGQERQNVVTIKRTSSLHGLDARTIEGQVP